MRMNQWTRWMLVMGMSCAIGCESEEAGEPTHSTNVGQAAVPSDTVLLPVPTPSHQHKVIPRVIPGNPEGSMLWLRARQDEDVCLGDNQKMPPGEPLDAASAQLIYERSVTGAKL